MLLVALSVFGCGGGGSGSSPEVGLRQQILGAPEGAPAAYEPPPFAHFVGKPGPTHPDQLPVDVAADGLGHVYTLDFLHQVVRKYDQAGQLLMTVPVGPAQGFAESRALAVDRDGGFYVGDAAKSNTSTDPTGAKIVKFDPQGRPVASWPFPVKGLGILGDRLIAASKFLNAAVVMDLDGHPVAPGTVGDALLTTRPEDAALSPDGTVYVTDGYHTVRAFDADGRLLRSYGSSTGWRLDQPASLATDAAGNLFVTDRRNNRVLKVSPAGLLLASVGSEGYGPGRFEQPHGVTVDAFGHVWVANYHGNNLQKFDNDLHHLLTVEGDDTAYGEFSGPRGVAVDSTGAVYVADMWINSVTKFDSRGNVVTQWGERGAGAGQVFNFPRFVAVDRDDNVYVASDENIRKFDRHGRYMTMWEDHIRGTTPCAFARCARGMAFDDDGGIFLSMFKDDRLVRLDPDSGERTPIGSRGTGPGQFDGPWGVAVHQGRLYVADTFNHRVQVLAPDGTPLAVFGSRGSGPGQFVRPTALAFDRAGRLVVADSGNGRIQVLDPDGQPIGAWGRPGTGAGQFTEIHALAIDAAGNVYATDWLNATVQKFGRAPVPQPPLLLEGEPPFEGADEPTLLAWREPSDPTWKLRLDGAPGQRFEVAVVSSTPLLALRGQNLEPSALRQHAYGFSFGATVSSTPTGVDLLPAAGSVLHVSVSIDGTSDTNMLHLGPQRQHLAPAGWMVLPSSLPAFPVEVAARERGLFLGAATDGQVTLVARGAGSPLRTAVTMRSAAAADSVRALELEADDTFDVLPNGVRYAGNARAHRDAVVARLAPDVPVAITMTLDGRLLPYIINEPLNHHGWGLGRPNAYRLP